jgi:hypothetical protein
MTFDGVIGVGGMDGPWTWDFESSEFCSCFRHGNDDMTDRVDERAKSLSANTKDEAKYEVKSEDKPNAAESK